MKIPKGCPHLPFSFKCKTNKIRNVCVCLCIRSDYWAFKIANRDGVRAAVIKTPRGCRARLPIYATVVWEEVLSSRFVVQGYPWIAITWRGQKREWDFHGVPGEPLERPIRLSPSLAIWARPTCWIPDNSRPSCSTGRSPTAPVSTAPGSQVRTNRRTNCNRSGAGLSRSARRALRRPGWSCRWSKTVPLWATPRSWWTDTFPPESTTTVTEQYETYMNNVRKRKWEKKSTNTNHSYYYKFCFSFCCE